VGEGAGLLSLQWDIDGDGDFSDATGADPTVSWSALQTAGVDDSGLYNVRVRANCTGLALPVVSSVVLLTVTNVAPTPAS
jgi:hypothetical protein